MGVREKLSASPVAGVAITIVLIAGAGAGVWWGTKAKEYNPATSAFYTLDDGKTLFEDDAAKAVSFTKDGRLAVRAHVYTCDNGRTRFVAYLERLPEGMQALPPQEAPADRPVAKPRNEAEARMLAANAAPSRKPGQFLTLVKKPGSKEWLKAGSPDYFPTITPKCADSAAQIDRVFPD